MSDYTKVDAGQMQQGIADLTKAHRAVTEYLQSLESELNSSLAQWDGSAREAYSQAKAQWDQAANRMSEVIAKMSSVMTNISDNYGANEANIASSWS